MKLNYPLRIQSPVNFHWLARSVALTLCESHVILLHRHVQIHPEAFNTSAVSMNSGKFNTGYFNNLGKPNDSALKPTSRTAFPARESAGTKDFHFDFGHCVTRTLHGMRCIFIVDDLGLANGGRMSTLGTGNVATPTKLGRFVVWSGWVYDVMSATSCEHKSGLINFSNYSLCYR